jgi:hypothetical protein
LCDRFRPHKNDARFLVAHGVDFPPTETASSAFNPF